MVSMLEVWMDSLYNEEDTFLWV